MGQRSERRPRFTKARLRGLEVLAERKNGAWRSNETSAEFGYIYWQTADWLVDHDFATTGQGTRSGWLQITDAGREALAAEGVVV